MNDCLKYLAYILNYIICDETIRLELEDTKGFDTTDRREPLSDEHENSAELSLFFFNFSYTVTFISTSQLYILFKLMLFVKLILFHMIYVLKVLLMKFAFSLKNIYVIFIYFIIIIFII